MSASQPHREVFRAERRARVLAMAKEGLPLRVISERTGLSKARVEAVLKEEGLRVPSSLGWLP